MATVDARANAIRAASLMLATLLALACAAVAQANVVRDDLGREVRFDHPPLRVISLLPSITETVCALDACGRLVATDRYSNWPPRVLALPKAGGLDDAEIELIVSLKPDLVLLSRSQRITDRLGDLGIKTFALNSDRYSDIAHNIRVIGEILGLEERARGLNEAIAADVQALAATAHSAHAGVAPSVYFEVDTAPYAAGPASFIGELLTQLGAHNIVSADLGAFPKLNPEYVVQHNPDVIFVSSSEAEHLAARPGWATIRAVRERRFCSFSADVDDTIVRPGPRVADGMRALADCLGRMSP
jgi:iron complex transport system substrate-binding protein